jgi:hypothetical protein
MDEQQQYDKICQPAFQRLFEKMEGIEKRLWEDNGHKSLQTRINENAVWCQVIKWITITLASGVLLGFISLLFWVVKTAIST